MTRKMLKMTVFKRLPQSPHANNNDKIHMKNKICLIETIAIPKHFGSITT